MRLLLCGEPVTIFAFQSVLLWLLLFLSGSRSRLPARLPPSQLSHLGSVGARGAPAGVSGQCRGRWGRVPGAVGKGPWAELLSRRSVGRCGSAMLLRGRAGRASGGRGKCLA